MNAQELTARYQADHQKLVEMEKTVGYMEQELQKLRMLMSDMEIDLKMLQRK